MPAEANPTPSPPTTLPWDAAEFVTITLPAVPGIDIAVPHHLPTPDPESILAWPVAWASATRLFDAPVLYRDLSPARRLWTASTIWLRSNAANTQVTLLLIVPRSAR